MKELTTIKKSILLLLLMVFVFSALGPLTASAQIPGPEPQGVDSIFADSAGCIAGGYLGGFVADLAIKGLNALTGLLPDKIKSWFGLEDEVPIHNQKDWTKQHILDLVARCGARAVLNDMTGRMIGAVRTSGRDCRAGLPCPSFAKDWRKFLAGGQYRGENIFRSILSSTFLCPHYSNNLKSVYNALYQPNLGQTPVRFGNLDPYSVRARCTMPSGWTLANYQLNFIANGGWEALTRLAEPQNNFYGSLLMSQGELQTQRSQSQTEDIIEAITGAGMTSRRADNPATRTNRRGYCSNIVEKSCTLNSECTFTGPLQGRCSELQSLLCTDDSPCIEANAGICEFPGNTGRCIIPRDDCLIRGPNNQCLVFNEILTPGSVLGHSVQAVINNELTWVTSVHEMEELMSNLTRLLMNRILNLAKPDVTPQEGFPGEPYPPFDDDPDLDPNLPNPAPPPPPPPPPPPGPGCSFDNYSSVVQAAMNTVVNTTTLDDGARDNQAEVDAFLNAVVMELRSMGLRAGRVFNPNTGGLRADTIIVGNSNDAYGTIYDLITSVGSPGRIGDFLQVICATNPADWSLFRNPDGSGGGGGTPGDDRLDPGETLIPGQSVVSQSGQYSLNLQGDGNLVLYDTTSGNALWSSGTNDGSGPQYYLIMTMNGDLNLYKDNVLRWWVALGPSPGAFLIVQNDGRIVIYDSSGATALWAVP